MKAEQPPIYKQVEGQHQELIGMEEVPLNAEPHTTITVETIEHDNIHHPTSSHSDYIKYFKLKLQDTNQNCFICCTALQCCSLWVGAHIWFTVWLILAVLNIVNVIIILNMQSSSVADIINLVLSALCIIALFFGIFGVHLCQRIFIQIFLYFMRFYIGLIVFVTISILFTAGITTMFIYNIIDIILATWTLFVFVKIYAWALYFKNGGIYDENMDKPEMDNIQQMHSNPAENVDLYSNVQSQSSVRCGRSNCNEKLIKTIVKEFYQFFDIRKCSNCIKFLGRNSELWVCPKSHFANYDLCLTCETKKRQMLANSI